jgi:hypothetical protein
VVAPGQEHPAGGGEEEGAVPVVLFSTGQARTHTDDIRIPSVSVSRGTGLTGPGAPTCGQEAGS